MYIANVSCVINRMATEVIISLNFDEVENSKWMDYLFGTVQLFNQFLEYLSPSNL